MEESSTNKMPAIAELNDIPGTMAPVEIKEIDPMDVPLWELDKRILNPFEELPPIMTWGKMGDRPAIERQGIITISAKPKQGKSLSVYALLTSIVSGKKIDTYTPDEARPRLVVVFDTEMNTPTLQRRVRGVYKVLGELQNRFLVVPLLSVSKKSRQSEIEDIISKYEPDIVVMDVVTKLVNDFNNSEENSKFGDWLEKCAANRTVIVVIHQNKAADNTNMKGHLGSILAEAAVENYTATMKDGVFTLTPVNARNSCAEGAPAVSFILKDDGTLEGASQVLAQRQEEECEVWRKDMQAVFGSDETLSYTELKKRIMSKQGLGESAAETKIKKASQCNAISKDGSTKNAPYKLT